MWYRVIAQVIRTRDGWTSSVGVPTFYLDSRTQGIVTDIDGNDYAEL